DGVLFQCLDLTEEVQELPIFEKFKIPEPVEGERWEVDGIDASLALISPDSVIAGRDGLSVHLVRLKSEWAIECLYRNGLEVSFSLHEVERGMQDLALILDETRSLGPALAHVDVTVRENIPVRFAEEIDPSGIGVIAQPVAETGEKEENAQEKHLRSILKGG
ncbi:MAG: hypothetical protein AAGC68_06920, partial [Verrucomicrobiota bacterium]